MQLLVTALVDVRVLPDYCGPGRNELLIYRLEGLQHVFEHGGVQVA